MNKNTLNKTEIFKDWFEALDDRLIQKRINIRIQRAGKGNFGNVKPVGGGVFEMRLYFGSGYRLYYFQHGKQLYWLLMGGDKSTQTDDIELAKAIKIKVERGEKC